MFEKVRNHTTVKVELIKREKKLLGIREIECINILEDIISLTITLDLNEKKNKMNEHLFLSQSKRKAISVARKNKGNARGKQLLCFYNLKAM